MAQPLGDDLHILGYKLHQLLPDKDSPSLRLEYFRFDIWACYSLLAKLGEFQLSLYRRKMKILSSKNRRNPNIYIFK